MSGPKAANRCLPWDTTLSRTLPSSRAAPAANRPWGLVTCTGRPTNSRVAPGATRYRVWPSDISAAQAARGTVRSAVGGLQAEVRPVVGGHEVHLLGMLLDVVPDEGAVGQNGQAALPRGGEDACYQRRPEAAAAHAGIDLGVRQRHRAAVDVVARQADDAVVDPDLEASPLGNVHHLRVHGSSSFRPARRHCRRSTCAEHGNPSGSMLV